MCLQLCSVDVRESGSWLLLGMTFYGIIICSSVEILDSISAGVSRLYSEITWTPKSICTPKYAYVQLHQVVDMNTQKCKN